MAKSKEVADLKGRFEVSRAQARYGRVNYCMTFRSKAEALAQYYARLMEKFPADASWAMGRRIAEKWLALLDAPNSDSPRVAELLEEVDRAERHKDAGSGIYDMSMSIHAWVSSRNNPPQAR